MSGAVAEIMVPAPVKEQEDYFMRMRRLEELRKVHLDIKGKRAEKNQTDNQKDEAMIWKAVERITELSNLARREGLLSLEEEVEAITLESEEEVLKQLLLLLVDGTEPVFFGRNRYEPIFCTLILRL